MIGKLIRNIGIIGPECTIGRALEYMRITGLSELPVVGNSRVTGVVTESAIVSLASSGDPIEVSGLPVSAVMSESIFCANPFMSAHQIAEMMKDHNIQVAPVVDTYGNYLGIVTRQDVLGVLMQTLRPPVIGGMATPLGVYLSSGNYRAGASDFGLVLSGVTLALMNFIAIGGVEVAAKWMGPLVHLPLTALLNSSSSGLRPIDILGYVLRALPILIFLGMFKILPLAGYHAAEHQVVNSIERGEPLNPVNVSMMPRIHPRCGTNLITAVILFTMVTSAFSGDVAILISLFVLIFAWRNVGGLVQYYVTTKRPNAEEIENGISAGRSLLEQYRENPGFQVTAKMRIWNTGMPQAMIGAVLTVLILQWLHIAPVGLF